MATVPQTRKTGVYVAATILIAIGLLSLVANVADSKLAGEMVVLAIGVAFAAAYIFSHRYGYLVPGSIMTGLGVGILVSDATNTLDKGTFVTFGIALGFIAIYVVDMLVTRTASRWWPVIPGGVMLLATAATTTDSALINQFMSVGGPLVLIGLGVILLLARGRTDTRVR